MTDREKPVDVRVVAELTGIEPLLTLDDLAALAGESRRTIERRVRDGSIQVVRLSSRSVRISAAEARRYMGGTRPKLELVAGDQEEDDDA